MQSKWQPTASFEQLIQRAAIINKIRAFFAERGLLEVETPLISQASNTDLHLAIMETQFYPNNQSQQAETLYLQTSPEFAMKRLLAAGSGDIYQICKAFRNGEVGQHHNPEFTMLEWYRVGFDHYQLMDEMDAFLQSILQCNKAQRISYQQLFEQHLQINPHQVSIETLQQYAAQQHIMVESTDLDKDDWLNILLTHCIEPTLGFKEPCFIYNYPASQAALAKISEHVAERFEVYINGIELANGFHELTRHEEQLQRFNQDLAQRSNLDYPPITPDTRLLQALEHGFPDCAGVALGIDRLIMIATQSKQLHNVIAFPYSRA